jgi:hypothetical protein
MRVSAALSVLALIFPSLTAAQLSSIRSGQYEITLDIKTPGKPTEPIKRVECIDAADVKDMATMFAGGEMENCKFSDTKTTGNTTRFNIACVEDGVRTTGSVEMTVGPETIAQQSTLKDEKGRVVTMSVFARRLGECRK